VALLAVAQVHWDGGVGSDHRGSSAALDGRPLLFAGAAAAAVTEASDLLARIVAEVLGGHYLAQG
jgi:hypothetical protein